MIIYKKVGKDMIQTISFKQEDCIKGDFSAKVDVEFEESPESNYSKVIVMQNVECCEDIEDQLVIQGYQRVDKVLNE